MERFPSVRYLAMSGHQVIGRSAATTASGFLAAGIIVPRISGMPIRMAVVVGSGSRGCGSTTSAHAGNRYRRAWSWFCLDSKDLGLGGTTRMGGWALGLPSLPSRSVTAARKYLSQRCSCVNSRRMEMLHSRGHLSVGQFSWSDLLL